MPIMKTLQMAKIDLGQITGFTEVLYRTPNAGFVLYNDQLKIIVMSFKFNNGIFPSGEVYLVLKEGYRPGGTIETFTPGFSCTTAEATDIQPDYLQITINAQGEIRVSASRPYVWHPSFMASISY